MKKAFLSLIILILLFISAQAQEYPLKIRHKLTEDSIDKFSDIATSFYVGNFYLEGSTFTNPYSPVFHWHLYTLKKQEFEFRLTNDKGELVTPLLTDSLSPGIYELYVENLWNQKKQMTYFLEAKTTFKSSVIKFLFLGKNILVPFENGLIVRNLKSFSILADSLSIMNTINKVYKNHFEGWILNVPSSQSISFELYTKNDSLIYYHANTYKAGLYEILLDSTIKSGAYELRIESSDTKIGKKFLYLE